MMPWFSRKSKTIFDCLGRIILPQPRDRNSFLTFLLEFSLRHQYWSHSPGSKQKIPSQMAHDGKIRLTLRRHFFFRGLWLLRPACNLPGHYICNHFIRPAAWTATVFRNFGRLNWRIGEIPNTTFLLPSENLGTCFFSSLVVPRISGIFYFTFLFLFACAA